MRRHNPDNKIVRENTPYMTPKGVEIGVRYSRPMPRMSRDEELIQGALLGRPHAPRVSVWLVLSVIVLGFVLVSCMGGRI